MLKTKLKGTATLKDKAGRAVTIDYDTVKFADSVCRAILHPLRKKILDLISANGETKVTAIYVKLKLEQSVASQHLAIMRKAGIVKTRRVGKEIHYSVDANALNTAMTAFKDLTGIETE